MMARSTFGEVAAIVRTIRDDLKARGIELGLPEFLAFAENLQETSALYTTRQQGWRLDAGKYETALQRLAQSRITVVSCPTEHGYQS
jgi:hypothetical protein